MNKKNNSKLNRSIIYLFIAFVIMMYFSTLIGLIILALVVIYNMYTSRYVSDVIKANKAYSKKDFTTALYYYSKAVECKSVPANMIRVYVIVQLKYGNPSEALATLTDILSHRKFNDSDILSLRVSKALILWKCDKIKDAFDLLNDLLESNEDTYIYETLSSLMLIHNKPTEALELLEKALKFDYTSDILKSNFAEANFKLGKIQVAEEMFLKLIDDNIQFVEPYYFQAKILISKGNIEHALELLKKALDTNDSLLTTVSKDDLNDLITSIDN